MMIDAERFPLLSILADGAAWTDEFPNGDEWAATAEEWLQFAARHGWLAGYTPRLRGRDKERGAGLSELATGLFLEKQGGGVRLELDPPGADGTPGDFLVGGADWEVFVEVNSPSWEAEARDRSDPRQGTPAERGAAWKARRIQGKHIDGDGGWTAPWRSVRDAIKRKNGKFGPGRPNVLMIHDDLAVPLIHWLENVRIALYSPASPGHVADPPKDEKARRNNYLLEDGCFLGGRFPNIAAVGILNTSVPLGSKAESHFALFVNSTCDPSVAIPDGAFPGIKRRRD